MQKWWYLYFELNWMKFTCVNLNLKGNEQMSIWCVYVLFPKSILLLWWYLVFHWDFSEPNTVQVKECQSVKQHGMSCGQAVHTCKMWVQRYKVFCYNMEHYFLYCCAFCFSAVYIHFYILSLNWNWISAWYFDASSARSSSLQHLFTEK